MLIGCITGPDLETAKDQLKLAEKYCDGVELLTNQVKAKGFVITTKDGQSTLSNGQTLSTYHNFNETPGDLESILDALPKADFYKICTMANKTTDALRMLCFVKNRPDVTGICMGELGQITRILGPVVSNPFTFAALGKEAAPGQLQAEELVKTYHFHRLTPTTKIYGLIGNPIKQSPSHKTHNAYYRDNEIDAVYVRMLLDEEELPLFFGLARELGISGLSVTIPFKEKVFPFIDEVEGDDVGAINTIAFEEKTYGSNTDAPAALDAIESKSKVQGKHCVILGAGGTAKALAFESQKRGASVTFLSRRFGNLHQVPPYDILINTTPVACPIDIEALQPRKVVMDVNVAHTDTPLMVRAKALGCQLVYGQEMFERQAQGQFARWAQTLSL
ncbi:MAG: type I 3-dehydroquinate dehydratase [Simkaniaceae bacterium]|nr:type I 3-dehydroquinate dehydratase [Candidatus Sacchlamyda saccharinae]